jgi:hypothetical protein
MLPPGAAALSPPLSLARSLARSLLSVQQLEEEEGAAMRTRFCISLSLSLARSLPHSLPPFLSRALSLYR